MKFKKEYALLGIVTLALALYLFLNKRDRTHYTLPEPPRLEAGDISKIEILKADNTVTLTRTDDQWHLTPGDYPADAAQVERMLETIAGFTITALVSETQSYARYELNAEHRIDVKAYSGTKLVRDFVIGKAAGTFRHTHVLLGTDKNVYHASGSFRWDFDKSIDDLRDKTILAFDRRAITAFSIRTGGKELALKMKPRPPGDKEAAEAPDAENQVGTPPAARWVTAEGQDVETAAVDQFLAALDRLKCDAFLAESQKASLTNPLYRVQLQGEETDTLEIFSPPQSAGTDFPGISSGSPYPFTLPEFEVGKIKSFYTDITGVDEASTPSEKP
ncbi:MAG: DUF4340 domain-containing protein [Desulfosarcina sp.]|nr:DUF4340 domain-containing protein [Desulfobacterales bacterium]